MRVPLLGVEFGGNDVRSGTLGKNWAKITMVVTWTVAVATLAAAGTALGARQATQPTLSTKLVGTWKRTLTQQDVTRGKPVQMPASVLVGARCTLSVRASGAIQLSCGRLIGKLGGTLLPLTGTTVRVELGDGRPNTWRWTVSGGRLTLTNVSDPSTDRITIFRGIWTRG